MKFAFTGRCAVWLVAGGLVTGGVAACGDAGDAPAAENEAAAADEPAEDTMPVSGVRGLPRPASGGPPGTLGDVTEGATMVATLEEWSVTLTERRVPVGQVTIAIENRGTMQHAIEISSEYGGRWRSAPMGPGGAVQMSMVLSQGDYRVYCPLESDAGNHSELGMETTLLVR